MQAVLHEAVSGTVRANETCPCGSGRLFSQCCDAPAPKAARNKPRAVAFGKGSIADLLDKARGEFRQGKLHTAEGFLRELLDQAPDHLDGLRLLSLLRKQLGDARGEETVLRRLIRAYPTNDTLYYDYATFLHTQGKQREAAPYCQKAVELNPHNVDAHILMGLTCIKTSTLQRAEYHLHQAYYLQPGNVIANVKLASVLRTLGRMEEARRHYRIALSLQPGNHEALLGWVRLEEASKNLERAWELQVQANARYPDNDFNFLSEATLHYRAKQDREALACLDRINVDKLNQHGQVLYFFSRGQVLDRSGDYSNAFAAFTEANRRARDFEGRCYDTEANTRTIAGYKAFFTRERLSALPRGRRNEQTEARPIFIVGFPRSGTSMVEQILTAHPAISAGDELILVDRMTRNASRWLDTDKPYPQCLAELARPGKQEALRKFRDYYFGEVRTMGLLEPGAGRFTDKMPLNEVHLGLMSLVFPRASIVHLIRHPLDVILSCYSNELQHGDNFAYDLETAARHYVLVMDLVEHYRQQLDNDYLAVRYEDLVEDVEGWTRRILELIGEPFDPRCVTFHENERYARTASYAQVTEKVYTRSVYRYRNYLDQLAPIIPIIAPVAARLGYAI